MSDQNTSYSNESWFDRIKNAIGGVIFGIILFIIAFPLLFWNETNAVQVATSLTEGAKSVIAIKSDTVDRGNEGKLVHTTGLATTDETLKDDTFGVSEKAIKIKRTVQIYQWKENAKKETKKKTGGGTETKTTYTYEMVWSGSVINSNNFNDKTGHVNTGSLPYENTAFIAKTVTLGAFTLPDSLKNMITKSDTLTVNESTLPSSLKGKVKASGNMYYIGASSASPQIGDVRISFEAVKPATVSIVSQQTGSTFQPYKTKNGRELNMLTAGEVNADQMFKQAQASNNMMTWIYRVVGFFLMFIGLTLVLKPISVLADVLPFLGNIAETGIAIVSFIISIIFWTLTVAIAWIIARPLIGIILFVVAAGAIGGVLFIMFGRKK